MKALTILFFVIDLTLLALILTAFLFRDVELNGKGWDRESVLVGLFLVIYGVIITGGGNLIYYKFLDGTNISIKFFLSLIHLIALLIIGYIISIIHGKSTDTIFPMKKTLGIAVEIISFISAIIGIIVFAVEY